MVLVTGLDFIQFDPVHILSELYLSKSIDITIWSPATGSLNMLRSIYAERSATLKSNVDIRFYLSALSIFLSPRAWLFLYFP